MSRLVFGKLSLTDSVSRKFTSLICSGHNSNKLFACVVGLVSNDYAKLRFKANFYFFIIRARFCLASDDSQI